MMHSNCENSLQGNRQFFQNQLLVLKYGGLWNPFEVQNWSHHDRNASKRYTVVATLLLSLFYYFYLLTEFMYLFKPTGEKDLSKAFFISATGYKMLFKIYYFLRQRKEYRSLVNEFQYSMALRPQNNEEEKFFTHALTMSKSFLNTFVVFAFGAVVFWGVVPIYNYFQGLPLAFPIAAWFPYADTYLSLFWVAYIYQAIGTFFIASITVALSSFEFTCFCFLNACIQTLSSRLVKIGGISNKTAPRGSKRRSQAYENIVDLVKHQLLVKRFIGHCEKLTQTSVFAEISFSSLIICITSFRIVTQEDTGIEFVSTLSYLGAMLVQIFQFCFVGNEITYSSNKLSISAFSSDFASFDKPTSLVFLILLNDLQQEICVCTGGSLKIKLNIETFLKVMKTSYSFMAVLKAMKT